MKIIEKNEGKKINYNLTGTKLDFADSALTLDLARYQQDDTVTRDIMVDSEGYLTTGAACTTRHRWKSPRGSTPKP